MSGIEQGNQRVDAELKESSTEINNLYEFMKSMHFFQSAFIMRELEKAGFIMKYVEPDKDESDLSKEK